MANAPVSGPKKVTIDISSVTLVKILFIFVLIVFLIYIREVFLLVFVAVILSSALDPWVDYMQKFKIPRAVGILLIYLISLLILSGAVYLIIPPVIFEVNQLAKDFPAYWDKITTNFASFQVYSESHGWAKGIEDSIYSLQGNIGAAADNVLDMIFSLFGGIISFFVILVVTFYMTVEEQVMKKIIRSLTPLAYQPYIMSLINRIQQKIGRWLRGQLLLSVIIFILSLLGLSILHVKYAFVLAFLAGITEIIPYFGPFIGAIPAIFIAFSQSPILALLVLILYAIIQFLENNLIVPKVMQKTVGLNPVITIIVLLVGARIAGILGVIMAVPVTTALSVIVGDLIGYKQEKENIE